MGEKGTKINFQNKDYRRGDTANILKTIKCLYDNVDISYNILEAKSFYEKSWMLNRKEAVNDWIQE